MGRITRRATGLGLASGLIAAPAIVRAQPESFQWRMVTSWPKNLPGPGVSAERLAKRIEAMTAGRISIQVYAAGELVPAFEVLDAVGGGTAEMAHTAAVFWMGKVRASAFFLAMPMGLTPIEHNSWIVHGGGQVLWDELYADFGVKPFMAGNTGMSMGGWFKQPLEGAADLQGQKFRMPGLGGEMYAPFGIIQVSLPPGEILPALQAGTIDAAEFAGPSSDLGLALYQAAPYYYWPGLHEPNGTGECLVNLETWNRLPDDLKTVIANACAAENAEALAEAELRNAAALKKLIAEGVELRRFPDDIQARAREAVGDIYAGFESEGDIERRILASYREALSRGDLWPSISVAAFHQARNPGT
ncbi:MAG: TRAP transporter substrate-binding protein [Geminicoccaceae bacterium]